MVPQKQQCPDSTTLASLIAGQLTEQDTAQLAAHLEDCEDCTRLATQIEANDPLIEILSECGQPATAAATIHPQDSANTPQPVVVVPEHGFDPPSRPGDIGRIGPYRLIERLGEGGMGVVFRGEDTALNRPVAIKVLQQSMVNQGMAKARFLREARAAASVAGDHVVKIHQVGEFRKIPYIAMELLQGETLSERLRRADVIPVSEIIAIGLGIARGLVAAHAAKVLHRDIKPANVWLEAGSQRVKILDFGLAKPLMGADLTAPGEVAGTPSYISPEQAAGEKVDARTDLFSLGCVLYELATRRRPFLGDTVYAALTALANTSPPRPRSINSKIPEDLEALIGKMLSKTVTSRPTSAQAVVAELEAIADGPRRPRRRRTRVWAIVPAIIALVVVVTWLAWPKPIETPTPNLPERPINPDEGLTELWSEDFDAGPAAWQLKYAASSRPSGTDQVEGRTALHLVPKIDAPANAYRELKLPADTATMITMKIRYAAMTPISAKYSWRFQVNLKTGAEASSASRPLFSDDTVLPGSWAEVRVRYAVVRGQAETMLWVNDQPTQYRLAPLLKAERSLSHLELVAGHQDVWFDDVRVLTLPTSLSQEWSEAMSGHSVEPDDARRSKLHQLAEILAAGTSEERRHAAAALQSAEKPPEVISPQLTISNDRRSVRNAIFTADGKTIVTAGGDGRIRTWDASDGTPIKSWAVLSSILSGLVVLPDGTIIAQGHSNGTLQAWNLQGEPQYELRGHTAQVPTLTQTTDGQSLVSLSRDGTIRRWDIAKKESRILAKFSKPTEFNLHSSGDGTIIAWNTDRQLVKLSDQEIPAARATLAFRGDGQRLVVIGWNEALQLWKVDESQPGVSLPELGKFVTAACYSPDSKIIALGYANGQVELRDAESLKLLKKLSGNTDRIYSLAFSKDGGRLASASQDNTSLVWQISASK
ncbi:MAG: protein kinase domain-containing protein [Fimbriiglobus sp.]